MPERAHPEAYTIIGKDIYGCAVRRSKGTCANRETILREEPGHRVLTSLRTRLMDPELVSAFIEEYTQAQDRRDPQRDRIRPLLLFAEREVGRTRSPLARPRGAPRNRAAIAAADSPTVHKIYERKVADLVAMLNADDIRTEAAEMLRGLIDKIVLTSIFDGSGCAIALHGDLATIVAFCEAGSVSEEKSSDAVASKPKISVVAGAGFVQTRTKGEIALAV